MDWIFVALLGAAVIHILEEYVYPGGFSDALKYLNPKAAHLITPRFNVIINGLFLLLCLTGAVVGTTSLVFSLSVASLVFFNAGLHIRGSIVARRYYPGAISAGLLYVPLAVYAYSLFLFSGQLTWLEAMQAVLLGALYMAVPMSYILSVQLRRRT